MAIEVPIPNWIHGPQTDPANAFISAFHVGSQLSLEQSKLQQAQIDAERSAQLQQQTLQANLERAQQEIANRHAYQQAMIGIRKQALDNAAAKNAETAARAAAKFASQQRFAEGLRTGKYKNVEEALFDNPALMTPGTTDELLRGKKTKEQVHFGEGGLVQRYADGKVETLVPATPKTSSQLALSRIRLAQKLPGMYQTLNELDPNSAEFRKQKDAIRETQNFLDSTAEGQKPTATGTNPPPAAAVAPVAPPVAPGAPPVAAQAPAVAPSAGTKFPEGSILRHKDGSRWIVQGGQIVPFSEEPTPEGANSGTGEGAPVDETEE